MPTIIAAIKQQGASKFNQLGEFLLLLRDPVCRPVFIFGTGVRSGLFDQLINILPYHRNALVKFNNRGASHRPFSRVENIQLSWDSSDDSRRDEHSHLSGSRGSRLSN
jgi:hypothetical protein